MDVIYYAAALATLKAIPVRALFGPAGIDRREIQAGCQNGEQR